jgi:general secretion pathway protein G
MSAWSIVVCIVIAAIGANRSSASAIRTATTDSRTLQTIVECWLADHPNGGCPSIEQLKADKSLKADQDTNDPWGSPYTIVCNGNDVAVRSNGPDGKPGTPDDLWAGMKP